MAKQPFFIQKRLARKTSDITKLADQYKSQINAVTGEYEKSFADYTAKRNQTMAPYEAAVGQYQQEYKGYEEALAGYRQRLADYTAKLEDINKNPLEVIPTDQYKVSRLIRFGTSLTIDGKSYKDTELPEDYTFENNVLYKRRNPGTFTDKAPTAPTAPTAPAVEEFDTTQFDAKRKELETGLKRELGERRASKIGAVSRKAARPLLQGT